MVLLRSMDGERDVIPRRPPQRARVMTEPGSETAPSLTAGDIRGTEGDSALAVPPLESESTVTREPVGVNPNGKPGGEEEWREKKERGG